MSEEKKTEEVETQEGEQQQCGCGQHGEQKAESCGCGHHGHHGWHMRHAMRRRMWMRFASMTAAEEVEFLGDVKARLEDRLSVVNERLAKLKA